MRENELKTPEQMAEKEVNKKLAKAIAERQLSIKRHEAEIKKLKKEIEKIKNGELVPDMDDEDDESSSPKEFTYKPSTSESLGRLWGYYSNPRNRYKW